MTSEKKTAPAPPRVGEARRVDAQRQAFIAKAKAALDAKKYAEVELLCAMFGRAYPDVADRARAAISKAQLAALEATPAPTETPAPAAPAAPKGRPLVDGFYTVALEGDGHLTFKVERQEEAAKFAPGEMIVSKLIGADNTSDYLGVAFAKDDGRIVVWVKHRADKRLNKALAILAQDPKAAGLGYAKASKRCYVCNRLLTTPESLEAGIGPVCAERGL